jgi:hypothetical protein
VTRPILLHRQTYSKLIAGDDPAGPIVDRVEHRITGRSVDFPEALKPFCTPAKFFANWAGVSLAVASEWAPQGAFLYRAVCAEGQPWGLFARLQPRSEAGLGEIGRNFTHFSVMAVDLADWSPALVWLVYQSLFALDGAARAPAGEPDTEADEGRMSKAPIPISTETLEAAKAALGDPRYWCLRDEGDGQAIAADLSSGPDQAQTLRDMAAFLQVEQGRLPVWALPIGNGIGFGAKGAGRGFALTVYAQNGILSTVRTRVARAPGAPLVPQGLGAEFMVEGGADWRAIIEQQGRASEASKSGKRRTMRAKYVLGRDQLIKPGTDARPGSAAAAVMLRRRIPPPQAPVAIIPADPRIVDVHELADRVRRPAEFYQSDQSFGQLCAALELTVGAYFYFYDDPHSRSYRLSDLSRLTRDFAGHLAALYDIETKDTAHAYEAGQGSVEYLIGVLTYLKDIAENSERGRRDVASLLWVLFAEEGFKLSHAPLIEFVDFISRLKQDLEFIYGEEQGHPDNGLDYSWVDYWQAFLGWITDVWFKESEQIHDVSAHIFVEDDAHRYLFDYALELVEVSRP